MQHSRHTRHTAATKRHIPTAREAIAKAHPNAALHLQDGVSLALAQMLASREVSGLKPLVGFEREHTGLIHCGEDRRAA